MNATPHPTARELAEKAALEIINAGYYPGDFTVQHQCASIIINATHLEALLKCVEALRGLVRDSRLNDMSHWESYVAAETALRELDQTKGDA